MGEGKLGGAVAEGGGQLGELAKETVLQLINTGLQAGFLPPIGKPLQELLTGEVEVIIAGFSGKILSDPLDEFPVAGTETFLLARGLLDEVSEICDGFLLGVSGF